MDIEEIRKYCLHFPHTTENVQWGDALCFKVQGKLFAAAGLDVVRLGFKCTPENFALLCERDGIIPAPYMARAQWVRLLRLNALPDDELRDLIAESYRLVWERLPKKRRAELEGSTGQKTRALKTATRKSSTKTKSAGARKKR